MDNQDKEIQGNKPQKPRLTRRQVLKAAGVVGAGLALGGLTGCDSTPENANDNAKSPKDPNQAESKMKLNPKEIDGELEGMFDKNSSDVIAFVPEDSSGTWRELRGGQLTVENISKDPRMRAALTVGAISSAADGPLPIGEAILVVGAGYVLCRILTEKGEEIIKVVNIVPNTHSKESRGEELAQYITSEVETAFKNPDPNDQRRKSKICGITKKVAGIGKVVIYAMEMDSINKLGIKRTAAVILGQRLGSKEIVHITTLYSRTNFDKFLKQQEKILDNFVSHACGSGGPFGPDDPSFAGP